MAFRASFTSLYYSHEARTWEQLLPQVTITRFQEGHARSYSSTKQKPKELYCGSSNYRLDRTGTGCWVLDRERLQIDVYYEQRISYASESTTGGKLDEKLDNEVGKARRLTWQLESP